MSDDFKKSAFDDGNDFFKSKKLREESGQIVDPSETLMKAKRVWVKQHTSGGHSVKGHYAQRGKGTGGNREEISGQDIAEDNKKTKGDLKNAFDEAARNIVSHIEDTFNNGDFSKKKVEGGGAAREIVKEYVDNSADMFHDDAEIAHLKANKEKLLKQVQSFLNDMEWER